MNHEVHDEPKGYVPRFGYVKSNPLNNRAYIEETISIVPEWAEILEIADATLERLSPGYNIAQIKTKFGEARFYVDNITGDKDIVGAFVLGVENAMTEALKA